MMGEARAEAAAKQAPIMRVEKCIVTFGGGGIRALILLGSVRGGRKLESKSFYGQRVATGSSTKKSYRRSPTGRAIIANCPLGALG
jgi:hypothetical protein